MTNQRNQLKNVLGDLQNTLVNSKRSSGRSRENKGPVRIEDADPIGDILNQNSGGSNRFVSNYRVPCAQSNVRQSKELDFSGGEDEIGYVGKAKSKANKSVKFQK